MINHGQGLEAFETVLQRLRRERLTLERLPLDKNFGVVLGRHVISHRHRFYLCNFRLHGQCWSFYALAIVESR